MKYSLRSLMIGGLLVILASEAGCRADVEKELDLKYASPPIPAGLRENYVPEPGSRDRNALRKGESSINEKEMYLGGYRHGWNLAVEQWRRDKCFKYVKKEDAIEDVFASTNDAIWLGYCEARKQIEERTRQTAKSP